MARDRIRATYSRHKDLRETRLDFTGAVDEGEFEGKWYREVAGIRDTGGGNYRIKVVSKSDALEVGVMTFNMDTAQSNVQWLNEDPNAQ